jgi:hypothetical protein
MSGSPTPWSSLVVDDGTFLAGTQALTLAFRMSAQRPRADGRVSEVRMSLRVKGCAMPALKPHACERAGEPAGRRRTSLDGGNRGVLRCGGNLTRLWRLKRSHYQSGDGELRQTRR